MKEFYSIVRIYFKGETETHSIEQKATLIEAQQRYFNILAADLANDTITYVSAFIIDNKGMMVEGRVFDRTPVEESEEPDENA